MQDYSTYESLPPHLSQFVTSGGMEKQALMAAGKIAGAGLLKVLGKLNLGNWGLSSGVKGLARLLGAAPKSRNFRTLYGGQAGRIFDETGKNVLSAADRAASRNAWGKGADWLYNLGRRIDAAGSRYANLPWATQMRALRQAGHGRLATNLNRAVNIAPGVLFTAPLGTMLAGAAGVELPEWINYPANALDTISPGMNAHPLVFAGNRVANTVTGFANDAQMAAVDAAEQAAKKTALGISDAIRNQGITGGLYNLFAPTSFAQTVLDRANEGIDNEIKTYRDLINQQRNA